MASGRVHRTMCPARTVCELVVDACPQSPAAARRHAAAWLAELDWPAAQAADVVLALNEAVTNAIEHGSRPDRPGQVVQVVQVVMAVEPIGTCRRLRIRVRDHGTWQPPPADPGHRGHGLILMRALMDELQFAQPPSGGTEVTLLSPSTDGPTVSDWRPPPERTTHREELTLGTADDGEIVPHRQTCADDGVSGTYGKVANVRRVPSGST